MTLADLKPGNKAIIRSIAIGDAGVERLMTMGLVEGAELTFVRASLGGDPLEFRVYGTALSLRRAQAREFNVEIVGDDG